MKLKQAGENYVQAVADQVRVSFRPAEDNALSHLQHFVQSLPHTGRERRHGVVQLAIMFKSYFENVPEKNYVLRCTCVGNCKNVKG